MREFIEIFALQAAAEHCRLPMPLAHSKALLLNIIAFEWRSAKVRCSLIQSMKIKSPEVFVTTVRLSVTSSELMWREYV